ncbi:MAG TPA: RNA polymerase sigma factor [Ktedonobacterales bacterium]
METRDAVAEARIAGWQRGEEMAAHAVFEVYFPKAARLAALNGLTDAEAQDCAQETLVLAFERRAQLRDPAAFAAWFYRIATNLCIDLLRQRARARRMLGIPVALYPAGPEDETQPHMQIAQPGGTDAIEWIAERDHIVLALRRLPPKYAAPLVMHGVHGLSYREIAEALGLTPGAAAVRLTRARDLFAKAYAEISL